MYWSDDNPSCPLSLGIGAPRILGCGGAVWPLGLCIFYVLHKIYVTKIMSIYPIWHVVMLQGKLKLTEIEENICIYVRFYYIFQYSNEADFIGWGWSVNHKKKKLPSLCLQNLRFSTFTLGLETTTWHPPLPLPPSVGCTNAIRAMV
jgi:hypothetical protein